MVLPCRPFTPAALLRSSFLSAGKGDKKMGIFLRRRHRLGDRPARVFSPVPPEHAWRKKRGGQEPAPYHGDNRNGKVSISSAW
jgi:hypothetical protein